MSGAMRRIGEYLGLLEDTGRYDDDYADDYDTYDERHVQEPGPAPLAKPSRREQKEARQAATVANLDDRRRSTTTVAAGPMVAELSRITTLHPRTYNEARTVGENYRDGTPVIMNLTEMDDNDAKRLVDFAAGLIFATRGSIERVTNKVFLLSPPNVSVAAEDKARIADGGFFNQS
jgi:cell division inhibitor SepF